MRCNLKEQVEAYRRDGFIVVEGVLSAAEIATLAVGYRRPRRELARCCRARRGLRPRAVAFERRAACAAHQDARISSTRSIAAVMRHETILEILRQLIGPAIRFDTSKLNMKSPGYGAAVEWHQDWAFYPHTNSDLCAVGVMMDDCGIENGPLICIPAATGARSTTTMPKALSAGRSIPSRAASTSAMPCHA